MKRIALTFCSVVLLLNPLYASAAAVSPSVLEVGARRGEVIDQSINVINARTTEQTYYLGVMKFVPNEETGTPKFISQEQDHSGLPDWINFLYREITVPANSVVAVPFQIVLPDDVKSGGHYAAITVSGAPSDVIAANGAIVDAKTAVLLLVTVTGETTEKAALLDFQTSAKRIQSEISGEFRYRIQNQGNVHIQPTGSIQFKDIFGRLIQSVDANLTEGRVLPESTRTYTVNVEIKTSFVERIKEQLKILAIGPVKAELNLVYGQNSEKISESISFWVIPWQSLLTLLIILLFIWVVFKRGSKNHK